MKIAVVGATGLVGGVMLQVLEERGFANCEIIPAASPKSVGKEIDFAGRKLKVVSVADAIAMKPDYAVFSAGADASRQYAPLFAEVVAKSARNTAGSARNQLRRNKTLRPHHCQPQLLHHTDGIGGVAAA